jgi:parallel beta-helix repeat protein
LALAGATGHPRAAAAVDCGDVLTGPTAFRLDRDLSCAGPTALTVRGGATLDLGRHVVTCVAGGIGIALAGTAARVANGTVTGCDVGVALSGEGHLVHGVRARFNGEGFRADAGVDGVRLRDNAAEFNRASGVRLSGSRNTISRNRALGNGAAAIAVVGDDNVVSRNRSNGNCLAGGCAAAYVIGGGGNQITRNLATGEDTGIALMPGTWGTAVTRNRVRFSLVSGILVERGATGNVLRSNVVRSTGTDLIDANGTCGANEWAGNSFDSGSPSCLE